MSRSEFGVTTIETARGWVGIAWSARGLVAVTLPEPSEADALRRLPAPAATPPASPAGLDLPELAAKLRRYFEGERVAFGEPLDPAVGTDFQRHVWAVCRAIPRGQTRTYGELAREVGSAGAARAVGRAMALNPWPVIVPCHRVVGSQGQLTGFGGGLDMKRDMLAMEGVLLRGRPTTDDRGARPQGAAGDLERDRPAGQGGERSEHG